MLRQVFIQYQGEMIYSYFFGRAYDNETLNLVLTKKLNTYIAQPAEKQIFSKPLFDYQSHFGMFSGCFFLFVTDMADRPKVIAKEIERASNLFKKNFPTPRAIKENSREKEEFTTFIKETFYYLHPKIALIGANGAGKSTITSLLKLKELPEKKMMNFAEYYQIQIKDLNFDLWDFVDPDDFSPLWNNYVRGSDVILYILDGSSLNDKKDETFINLFKREGKFSRTAIILTHLDQPNYLSLDNVKKKYVAFTDLPAYEINLIAPDAKQNLIQILSDAIGLKKALPGDFRAKLIAANEAVSKEDFETAIIGLEELVKISIEHQEMEYAETFKKKIEELKEKFQAKKLHDEQERLKISAPKQIQFDKVKGVKTLPTIKGLPGTPGSLPSPINTSLPTVNTMPIASQNKPILEPINAPSEPEKKDEEEMSVLTGIQSANPFFSGLKPLSTKPTPTTSPLPKLAPEPIPEPNHEPTPEPNIKPSEPEKKDEEEMSVLTGIQSANPFFSGLKPLSTKPTPTTSTIPKVAPEPIPESTPEPTTESEDRPPLPQIKLPPIIETITGNESPQSQAAQSLQQILDKSLKIQLHQEMQKVKPIDIDALEKPRISVGNTFAEQIMEQSMKQMQTTPTKKMTMERSPLIRNEIIGQKSDIEQSNPLSSQNSTNALETFMQDKKVTGTNISEYAEKLGDMIRDLGESLSRDMCEKFIAQLQFRLKKTNLTEEEITNAANLYVKQRRKIAAERS